MIDAHNLEAEQSLIGAILVDAEHVIPEVIDIVRPEDCFVPRYGEYYRYGLDMTSQGKKIDFVTMTEVMKSKVDGDVKQDLLTCADMVPSVANAKAYAEIVAKNAKARRLQAALMDATYTALTADNVDEITENLMSTLFEQSEQTRQKGLQPISAGATEWYMSLFKKRPDRVNTGFTDLDYVLRGMYAGNLVLLAARPAVGKSAFAFEIARRVAQTGKTVNIYSCEMEQSEIVERMAANESGVDMDMLIDNEGLQGHEDTVGKIARAVDTLYKLPINISDNASVTTAQIRAQSRMTKNLGLIIVDYIQLLKSTRRAESRNVEVGEISRSLKILANDLKVPVLALSQLSREIEKRGASNKEPQMSDLRDSGSLEQDANKIMFMYPLTDDEKHMIVAVKVAKNRRGHVGEVQFLFDGAHMRHKPLAKSDYIKHQTGKMQYDNNF